MFIIILVCCGCLGVYSRRTLRGYREKYIYLLLLCVDRCMFSFFSNVGGRVLFLFYSIVAVDSGSASNFFYILFLSLRD